MGCLIFLLIIIALFLIIEYPALAFFMAIIVIFFGIKANQDKQERIRLRKESKERARQAYNDIKAKMVPGNTKIVSFISGNSRMLRGRQFVWINNNNLYFFPADPPANDDPSNLRKITTVIIPINKIDYYTIEGEVVYENKITGGGGGGSSLEGAIVGGLVAGDVGAVIGSRKTIDPIKSELVTHDRRKTIINYFDDRDVKKTMIFAFKDYSVFYELIPEKALEIVNAIKTDAVIKKLVSETSVMSIADQIRELAELKEEGVLTEEEFVEKKKILLDKI
jgi:hypothetical protein